MPIGLSVSISSTSEEVQRITQEAETEKRRVSISSTSEEVQRRSSHNDYCKKQ